MNAETVVEVSLDDRGRSVVSMLRCESPLLVRVDGGAAILTLLLVGGAAGPIGGDDLRFSLRVGQGASGVVRSVAAMLVQPGPVGGPSVLTTAVSVGEGASLDWETQPMISVAGSDHRSTSQLVLAADATARWSETVVLGRHDEPSGRLALHQRIVRAGAVELDHELVLGTGAPSGPGAHGDVRWVQSELVVGDTAATRSSSQVSPTIVSGVFPLSAGVSLSTRAGVVPSDILR